jgi:hypothetical protein
MSTPMRDSPDCNVLNAAASNSSIYDAPIAAVIAYFGAHNYKLAAELLGHAKFNKNQNSIYHPVHGDIVGYSPVMRKIAKSSKKKGSSAFENEGNTQQKDIFYAIHLFNWVKSGSSPMFININDAYDYEKGDYASIAGVAVNTMYRAQEAGVLTKYTVSITYFPPLS